MARYKKAPEGEESGAIDIGKFDPLSPESWCAAIGAVLEASIRNPADGDIQRTARSVASLANAAAKHRDDAATRQRLDEVEAQLARMESAKRSGARSERATKLSPTAAKRLQQHN